MSRSGYSEDTVLEAMFSSGLMVAAHERQISQTSPTARAVTAIVKTTVAVIATRRQEGLSLS
jgi:hypothetical protein